MNPKSNFIHTTIYMRACLVYIMCSFREDRLTIYGLDFIMIAKAISICYIGSTSYIEYGENVIVAHKLPNPCKLHAK